VLLEISSGSARFGFIFRESVRVRFGSGSFFVNQFEFGSVQVHSRKIGSSSVRIDSNRTEPN
jgi:hypothetical protein